jgi:recombination protein RecA
MTMTREELIDELGNQLVTVDCLSPSPGLSTGWPQLDRFLLWHGFPKSALSLMVSDGGGATTLWIRSAALITQKGQWAAWMNEGEMSLTPWALRSRGVDLAKLLCVSPATDNKQTLWALQELMSSCLFEIIGCDLGRSSWREHEILKLRKLAMRYQTALVFITRAPFVHRSSNYSLILNFGRDHVSVDRALHRPTPHLIERKELYADTLPQLAAGRRALCG